MKVIFLENESYSNADYAIALKIAGADLCIKGLFFKSLYAFQERIHCEEFMRSWWSRFPVLFYFLKTVTSKMVLI